MRQKGFTPVLILILTFLVIASVYYINTKRIKTFILPAPTKASQSTLPPLPSPGSPLYIPSNWEVFIHESKDFSFRYPSNWYSIPDPEFSATGISFFINDTEPDFSYGDYIGNEVLAISYSKEGRSLEYLRNEYFPKANYLNISGKHALKTGIRNPLYIIQISESSQLDFMTFKGSEEYIDQIVLSLNFNP